MEKICRRRVEGGVAHAEVDGLFSCTVEWDREKSIAGSGEEEDDAMSEVVVLDV